MVPSATTMTTCIALLRGINVGGHNRVPMAGLRDLLTKLGLKDVQSLLQSGNVVFHSERRTGAQLEKLIESEIEKRIGLKSDVCVRSAKEWHAIVAVNPFAAEAARDPSHMVVMCLKDAPSAADVEALRAAITGPELVEVHGREAYFVYPVDIGRSRLTTAVIERKLRSRGTARNWNTVLKLDELAGE